MLIFAEVKTQSPFGWKSNKKWEELFELAAAVGHVISVHTDPRWGGSFDLLARARSMTYKPILAKGIHTHDDHIRKAVDLGANYVLCVGRIPSVHRALCLIEPYNVAELAGLTVDDKAVWNSRDLRTGGLKVETFAQARSAFRGWLCQASNVRAVADINPSADGVLVGTNLIEFAASMKGCNEIFD